MNEGSENCLPITPIRVDEVKEFLDQSQKGKVYNTAANYKRFLQYDPLLKGAIKKNLLTDRIDIVRPLGWYRENATLTDIDVKYLLLYFEENYGLSVEKKVTDTIAVIANENRYHPVRDFLNSLQWDGTEHIRFCLHHFLGSDTDDYTYEALKLFLLDAIPRAFKPGCKFESMLCLVGGQGCRSPVATFETQPQKRRPSRQARPGGSFPSWFIRKKPRFTSLKMRKDQERILTRCGQRRCKFTEAAFTGYGSIPQWTNI